MGKPIAEREMTLEDLCNSSLVIVSEKQRNQIRNQHAGQLDKKVNVTAKLKGK